MHSLLQIVPLMESIRISKSIVIRKHFRIILIPHVLLYLLNKGVRNIMSTVKNAWDFEGAEENSRDRLRSENIFRNAISESLLENMNECVCLLVKINQEGIKYFDSLRLFYVHP